MKRDEVDSLAKALDAIDGIRRRAYLTLIAVMVLLWAAALRYWYVTRTDDLKATLGASVAFIIIAVFTAAFATMFWMTRMTKRILRAIHLASQEARSTVRAADDS